MIVQAFIFFGFHQNSQYRPVLAPCTANIRLLEGPSHLNGIFPLFRQYLKRVQQTMKGGFQGLDGELFGKGLAGNGISFGGGRLSAGI